MLSLTMHRMTGSSNVVATLHKLGDGLSYTNTILMEDKWADWAENLLSYLSGNTDCSYNNLINMKNLGTSLSKGRGQNGREPNMVNLSQSLHKLWMGRFLEKSSVPTLLCDFLLQTNTLVKYIYTMKWKVCYLKSGINNIEIYSNCKNVHNEKLIHS